MKRIYRTIVYVIIGLVLVIILYSIWLEKDGNILSDIKNIFVEDTTFSDELAESDIPFSDYCYSKLTQTEKQAYACIYNEIRNHPERISVPNITSAQLNTVYYAVKNDNPGILCFADSCTLVKSNNDTYIELRYDNDKDTCDAMTAQLKAKADEVMSVVNTKTSEFDKELYIHDYIIENCTYLECDNDDNAYGCLVNGKAVCSGYSRATMLLLRYAGIKTTLISGTGVSEKTGNISHMWNIVWLDGEPYHLDTTWDDPLGETPSISHIYFNMPDSLASADHKDTTPGDIVCNSDKYYYYKYKHLTFDSYDDNVLNEIGDMIVSSAEKGEYTVDFVFSNVDAYNMALTRLLDNSGEYIDMSNLLNDVNKRLGNILDISHIGFSQNDDSRYIELIFDTVE